jgi:hypothetical protein
MATAPQSLASTEKVDSSGTREELVRALRLDIVGPEPDCYSSTPDDRPYADERLPVAPSRWYLTGFLVPYEAGVEQKSDDEADEQIALTGGDSDGVGDDDPMPEQTSARKVFFPSSIGVSVLVPKNVSSLDVVVSWGDYAPENESEAADAGGVESGAAAGAPTRASAAPSRVWRRTHYSKAVSLSIPKGTQRARKPIEGSTGPEGGALSLVVAARPVRLPPSSGVPDGTRAVALFLVNERKAAKDEEKDRAFIFQAGFSISCGAGFVPRPNPRGANSGAEWDERVADLQYRDAVEYATGHGVSVESVVESGSCNRVRTTWSPRGTVEVVEPAQLADVELKMEVLGYATADELRAMLQPITKHYAEWLKKHEGMLHEEAKRKELLLDLDERRDMAKELLNRAATARNRIEDGISLLQQQDDVRQAFQIANRAMAMAARQRAVQSGRSPTAAEAEAPTWRPFQLAFLLMTLRGVAEPTHADRGVVDLLFFPTGGGKTEAYLGLAATTLVLRRLRNPGVMSSGVSVLMRYTLRLLTLDQLGRAAGLVCALELLREKDPGTLGKWPFEIGLWVGRAATPNRMGKKGDPDQESARKRVIAYKTKPGARTPIPLENCPWCGTKFTQSSFQLLPDENNPSDLRVTCASRSCDFNGKRPLPVLTVDEPIYRRLPCFVIATVDKFAALPWVGHVGAFFGRVQRYDAEGFYGPCDLNRGAPLPASPLPAPDLIIQDELHLISGPLGTVAGLYEAAIDALAEREIGGVKVRPKIVASTATVRRAEAQIQALFGRKRVELFPPASPDRRDSFFARTATTDELPPRLYLGLAAPGRSLKVLMLRSYLALLCTAQREHVAAGGDKNKNNPADPYMTLVGYFNALRELGGSRRIVEDEVTSRALRYGDRKRIGEAKGLFADRSLRHEVTELTSREPMAKVSDAKRRLALSFTGEQRKEAVDVALATNMISVGLDITRLGLMVVLGQPKSSAEYIQATSRVGRDSKRPGLVVTLLNVHRPRDRSHFERFAAYHSTFYRAVEATSVTPFAPRAVDRALAGVVVGLARQELAALTPPLGADVIEAYRAKLDFVADLLGDRARDHNKELTAEAEELRQTIRARVHDLLDAWAKIAHNLHTANAQLEYQREVGKGKALLVDPLDPSIPTLSQDERKFRAHRSMRDVEPDVALWIHGEVELEEV